MHALVLKHAARRHPERSSDVPLSADQVTGDALAIIHDPDIDIVVELIGGYEPARTYLLEALRAGKHVVTANKALLAEHGQELFEAAAAAGRDIGFEASVGGGIPVIRTIKEGFVANRFGAIASIINGTCNYILSRMSDEDLDFAEALKEAQALGYAEADPHFDVAGIDAAQKIALLASLAFGSWVPHEQVYTEGIDGLSRLDIAYANELGTGSSCWRSPRWPVSILTCAYTRPSWPWTVGWRTSTASTTRYPLKATPWAAAC